jgi:adenylate cyclase
MLRRIGGKAMPGLRKLAAILVADVVGFSRLAGLDEDRTLARLRALRSDLVDPTIAVHNGRVVKGTGDGVLVEFRSVVDAVRCAIEIQDEMVERNLGVPPESRIEYRIGIHIGDVVEESDGDLMGDGVNIAARLEGIADPGAICVSEDVYRQVRSKLDISVDDLGETALKNIAEPMRLYLLQAGAAANVPEADKAEIAAPTDQVVSPSLTDKPSIAVLPFTNMSGDPDQEYFVDGMVEDIITALSRFDQLFVIARNSSFVFKGRAVDVKQVSRELGVHYVLEGSVRKAGDRVRITGQLIDGALGTHLWADRFDGGLADVFDLQDRITASVVGAIEPTIRKAEIERARRKQVDNLSAYDLYLRALPHIYAIHPEENLKAVDLLNQAIELDPNYASALAHLGWCLVQRITRAWPPVGDDDKKMAVSLARRALATGSDEPISVVLGGFILVALRHDYHTGLDAARRAVSQNPGSGFINSMAGYALVFGDDLELGLSLLNKAMALGPLDPNFFSHLLGCACAHLFSGRPDLAAELAERSIALNSKWDSSHLFLIASYAQLDRLSDAQAALARLLEITPDATVSRYKELLPIRNPASLEIVLDGLRSVGLPE